MSSKDVSRTGSDSDRSLTPRQKQIVDHILTTGDSPYDAEGKLGTSASNIYRVLRYPHVKKYIHDWTVDHIGLLAPIAARTQGELLNAQSEHVRATVSEAILNRHLGRAIERKQVAFQGNINVSIDLS